TRSLLWVVVGISLAVAIPLSFTVIRFGISGPLGRLARTMREMSDGQLDITVDGTIRGDEVGLMAKSVEVFRVNGLEARRVAAEAEAARQAE
ncbi:HAMP domain-containing protein, partial [Acinetobacter baumannii]